MGWWSCTIMGGDTPYDARGDMYDVCGLTSDMLYPDKMDDRVSDDVIAEAVKANVPAMIKVALKGSEDWYPGVYRQVLGVLVMSAGCDSEDKDVKRALKIAKEGAEADEWNNDERRAYVADFIKMLDNYDGTPQEPKEEGLFQKFEEAFASGTEGLINKQPT